MERKVVWVQGYRNLAKKNILILDFIYLIGDISDDDVINIYLDAIVDYLGKNCALENSRLKKYSGTIIVRKVNLQIEHIVSLKFGGVCGIDEKNSQCYEKEKILTISMSNYNLIDCSDKAFDLALVILLIDDCTFNMNLNVLIDCNYFGQILIMIGKSHIVE